MSALEETWSRTGFAEPRLVERWLLGGTVTGLVAFALSQWALRKTLTPAELSAFVVSSTAALMILTLPKQALATRAAFGAAACVLALFVPWNHWMLPFFFTGPLGLALAMEPKDSARRLAVAVGPSLGAAWCLFVAKWLSMTHLGPASVLGAVTLAGAGLFISAGAALGWTTFATDAMEPRLAQHPKVKTAWLKLRTALRKLPKGPARTALTQLAYRGAEGCLETIAARDEVSSALDVTLEQESRDAVSALEERLQETEDEELRTHLHQLVRVHRDTLEQFDGLRRKVERHDARAAAELGWLETAAFSVELAPKTEASLGELHGRLSKLRT